MAAKSGPLGHGCPRSIWRVRVIHPQGEVQMIKFRCGQCGNRIAVPKRRLNQVILCPDCSAVTHPIAEQVIERRSALALAAMKAQNAAHTCANCSHPIGKLQKLHLWENKVVCGECHRKLSAEHTPAPATTALSRASTTPVAVARRERRRAAIEETDANFDPVVQTLTRPFRGGLFGALVGLCVAAAALYGAMSLLREVAGIVTGLAIGGLALLFIYLAVRSTLAARRQEPESRPVRRVRITEPDRQMR
jgi:predicted RNA-binding Zn-ribbon protein involved in translation (DUF1610 family)